jgi:hypothetical protein
LLSSEGEEALSLLSFFRQKTELLFFFELTFVEKERRVRRAFVAVFFCAIFDSSYITFSLRIKHTWELNKTADSYRKLLIWRAYGV